MDERERKQLRLLENIAFYGASIQAAFLAPLTVVAALYAPWWLFYLIPSICVDLIIVSWSLWVWGRDGKA